MRHIDTEFIQCINILDLKAVTASLANGANVHIYDDYALTRSAETGNLDIVLKLLEHGADLHAQNDYALRHSAKNGYIDIVEVLLERGASINPGFGVISALEYSARYNHSNVTIKLLKFGANVHVGDDAALRVSCDHEYLNMATILLEHGASVSCDHEYLNMATILLEHGASVCCANKIILERLRGNFNRRIADIVLPYCEPCDYEYFPNDYIRAMIIPTKNAMMQRCNNAEMQ